MLSESMPATDVMICNLNPTASGPSNVHNGDHSVEWFHGKVTNVTVCEGCTATDKAYWMSMRHKVKSTIGYFEYLGKAKVNNISHSQKSFIVDCKALMLAGVVKEYFPCDQYYTIHEVITQYLFKCFVLRPTELALAHSIYGSSVVLYLDNFDFEWHKYFSYSSDFLQRKGVLLNIISPGHPPLGARKSMFFPPGTFTEIKLAYELRTRMGSPYGSCNTDGSVAHLYRNKTWAQQQVLYDEQSCVSLCFQQKLINACGCIDTFSTIHMDDTELLGYPYCSDVAMSADAFKVSRQCMQQNALSLVKQCGPLCPQVCQNAFYDVVSSNSIWPIDPIPEQFYAEYIRGRPYEFRFNRELFNDSNMYNMYGKESEGTYLVRNNFMRIDTYFSENIIIDLKDEVKITMTGLISQLGGTLNLWSGITVILIVEFLDFFIKFVTNCKMVKSNKETLVIDLTKQGITNDE